MNIQIPFIQDKRLTTKEILLSVIIYALVTVIIRYHGLSTLSSQYLGGASGDAGLYVWLFNSNIKQMLSEGWFNTAAFYPYTKTLAWSDNFLLPSFIGLILTKLGISQIISYNLVFLAATFLNGFCTFLVAAKLSGRSLPALAAGVAFMAYGFFCANIGHPQLQFAFFIPLSVYFLISFFSGKKFYFGILLGLTEVAAFLSTVYYAVFIPPLLFIICGTVFLLRPSQFTLKDFTTLAISCLLGTLPIIPFLLPYLAVKETFGVRDLSEPYAFAATTLSYLGSNFWRNLTDTFLFSSEMARFLSSGVTVTVLAFYAILRLKISPHKKLLAVCSALVLLTVISSAFNFKDATQSRDLLRFITAFSSWFSIIILTVFIYKFGKFERSANCSYLTNRDIIIIFAFCAYIFFIFSLGPLGNTGPKHKELAFGVFSSAFYLIPGMNSVRDISRFCVVVTFCLALLIPFAIMNLTTKKRSRLLLTTILCSLIIFENYYPIFPVEPLTQTPPIFKVATMARPQDVTMVLPLTTTLNGDGTVKSWQDYAVQNTAYMNMAAPLELKIFNGYSGMITKLMRDYPRKMANFPDNRSLIALTTISGLRFILFDATSESTFEENAFAARLKEFQTQLIDHGQDSFGWKLFELIPNIPVTDNYFLQVPSYPQGKLQISLRSPKNDNKICNVELFAKKRIEDSPFYTLTFPANGSWHTFEIPIPKTEDSVRPLRIVFKEKEKLPLFIGENHFIRIK